MPFHWVPHYIFRQTHPVGNLDGPYNRQERVLVWGQSGEYLGVAAAPQCLGFFAAKRPEHKRGPWWSDSIKVQASSIFSSWIPLRGGWYRGIV